MGRRVLDSSKSRPLKIVFTEADMPLTILKKKGDLPKNGYKIAADQTVKQHLNIVRQELNERIQNGENDLTIKFVRGVPKNVKIN